VTAEVLKHLRSSVQVRVDGRVVLRQSSQAFPARPEQIQVGLNTVGASTCVEVFSGKIERVEFLGVPELP